MNRTADVIKIVVVSTAILFGLGLLLYADFRAYQLRFPHAPVWTYFFRD